jgi:hypothetical protein
MILILVYTVALFFLGLGNAVITYHILRYRDAGDASGVVLTVYYVLVFTVLFLTAISLDWTNLTTISTLTF